MGFILFVFCTVLSNSSENNPNSSFNGMDANLSSTGDKIQFDGRTYSQGNTTFNNLSYSMIFSQSIASTVKVTGVDALQVVNNNKKGSITVSTNYEMESGSLYTPDVNLVFNKFDATNSYFLGSLKINNEGSYQNIRMDFKSGNFKGTSKALSMDYFSICLLNITYCDYEQDAQVVNNTYKYKITKASGSISSKTSLDSPKFSFFGSNNELLGENVTFIIGGKTYNNASLNILLYIAKVEFMPKLEFKNASFDLIIEIDPASSSVFKKVTISTPSIFSAVDKISFSLQQSAAIIAYDASTAVEINIPLQKYPLTSRFGFWYQNVRFIKFTKENLANFDLQTTNTLELAFDMSNVKKINPQANIFSIFFSKNASPLITISFNLDKIILTFPPGTMNTETVINIVYNDSVTASYFKFNQAGNFYDATFASKMFVGGGYSTVINNPSSGSLYFKNSVDTSRSNQSLLNIQNLVQSKKVKKQISESDFDFIKTRTAFIADSEKFSDQISRRLRNGRTNNDFRTVLDEYEATVNITLDLLKNGAREFPTEVIANSLI